MEWKVVRLWWCCGVSVYCSGRHGGDKDEKGTVYVETVARVFQRQNSGLGMKSCTRCHVNKEYSEFRRDGSRPDGHSSRCEPCIEKGNAYARNYRVENSDLIRRIKRRWKRNNPDKVREAKRRWREKHPEVVRESKKRRRAAKAGALVTLTHIEAAELVGDRTGICGYCGNHSEELTQDHIAALTEGGDHSLNNIVMVCRPCNSRKGVQPVLSWLFDSSLAKTALSQLRMEEEGR